MIDRSQRRTISGIIQELERWAVYVALGVLIVGELLATFVPALHDLIDERWALIILASVLLIMFRVSDRYIKTLRPDVEAADFMEAVTRMAEVSNGSVPVNIFANDGSRYFQFLVETKIRIETLRVLLYDPRDADKWDRLVESGVAQTVEVHRCDVKPTIHYMTVGGSGAMFGLFFREGEKVSTGRSFAVSAGSVSSRDLVEAINTHFGREWRLSENG